MELLAKQTSQYQGKAASVAAQGYFLAGIVALHQNNISAMEAYRKQGVVYAQLSGDQNLHVAALMHLACAYYYNKRPLEALETFQNALLYIDQASPLVRACVYARMAKVYAQCGQEQPARRCLGLAREAFPLHTVDNPFALFADGGHHTLFLWEGLTLLELDEPRQAQEVLAQMATLPSQIIVPRRTLAEATNHQAEAAIASGNKELFIPLIKAGARGASELGSEKRRQEVWDFYGQARRVWSNDAEIKNLREELLSY
jgi:tetratricopeptide (TPR) repeat protein